MPSQAYVVLAQAIQGRAQVICDYQGYTRHICPHALGYTEGRERVLAFQFAGGSSTGLPAGGQWRCMNVDEMRGVTMQEGEWHTGATHGRPQTCVKRVEYEVAY